MKANDILSWIIRESIDGENLFMLEVPEEGDAEWEQNEEWWVSTIGSAPPAPLAAGRYLFYYSSQICNDVGIESYANVSPDAEIEAEPYTDSIYFYLIED